MENNMRGNLKILIIKGIIFVVISLLLLFLVPSFINNISQQINLNQQLQQLNEEVGVSEVPAMSQASTKHGYLAMAEINKPLLSEAIKTTQSKINMQVLCAVLKALFIWMAGVI